MKVRKWSNCPFTNKFGKPVYGRRFLRSDRIPVKVLRGEMEYDDVSADIMIYKDPDTKEFEVGIRLAWYSNFKERYIDFTEEYSEWAILALSKEFSAVSNECDSRFFIKNNKADFIERLKQGCSLTVVPETRGVSEIFEFAEVSISDSDLARLY